MPALAGTLTTDTGTGTKVISCTGVDPNCVIFFGAGPTATGTSGDDGPMSFGAATSGSARCASIFLLDNQATTDSALNFSTSSAWQRISTSAVLDAFTVSAFGTGDFTINQTTAATARKVGFLALEVDDVAVGSFAAATSTGNQDVTGLSFQPDAIILFSANHPTADAIQTNATLTVGFGDGTNQGCVQAFDDDGVATTISKRYHSTSDIYHVIFGATTVRVGNLSTILATGFRINWTQVTGTAYVIGYVAIKGNVKVVADQTLNNSTGAQEINATTFTPEAVLMASTHTATTDTANATLGLSLGAASGSSAQAASTIIAEDAASTSDSDHRSESDAMQVHTASSGTVIGETALTTLDSDGFTIDRVTAPAFVEKALWLAIAETLTPITVTSEVAALEITGNTAITAVGAVAQAATLEITGNTATGFIGYAKVTETAVLEITGYDAVGKLSLAGAAQAASLLITGYLALSSPNNFKPYWASSNHLLD